MASEITKLTTQESAWLNAQWFKEADLDMTKFVNKLQTNYARYFMKDNIKLLMFFLDSLD